VSSRLTGPSRWLAIAGLLTSVAAADELKYFTTDGCSSFPDGTLEQKQLWRACCVVHDLAYWKGGSKKARKDSDLELKACVAKVGEPGIAELMLAGVRVGGTPWLPTRFRWGYGWPFLRGYTEIADSEVKEVERKLETAAALLREENVEIKIDLDLDPN